MIQLLYNSFPLQILEKVILCFPVAEGPRGRKQFTDNFHGSKALGILAWNTKQDWNPLRIATVYF